MSETTENTTKTKSEATKIDGISAQINLSPGSETHKRFARLMKESGATTTRSFIDVLMDAYENQPNDLTALDDLNKQLTDLRSENAAYDATCQNLELEIADLKVKLEEAQRLANENAEKGLGRQLRLDELTQQLEGGFIVKPNPVVAYFLDEMAEKQQTTPGKILEKLFVDDLQNPRANNLPYTVSASRIREVMEELKPKPNA